MKHLVLRRDLDFLTQYENLILLGDFNVESKA